MKRLNNGLHKFTASTMSALLITGYAYAQDNRHKKLNENDLDGSNISISRNPIIRNMQLFYAKSGIDESKSLSADFLQMSAIR